MCWCLSLHDISWTSLTQNCKCKTIRHSMSKTHHSSSFPIITVRPHSKLFAMSAVIKVPYSAIQCPSNSTELSHSSLCITKSNIFLASCGTLGVFTFIAGPCPVPVGWISSYLIYSRTVHCSFHHHHSVVCLTTVHILFQSQFSTDCNLMLLLSLSSNLSFPLGHPVAAYVLFLVFQSLLLSITCVTRQFIRQMWPIRLAFLLFLVFRTFLSSLILRNTSSFPTRSVRLIFTIIFQQNIKKKILDKPGDCQLFTD